MGMDYYARAVVGLEVEVLPKRVVKEVPVFNRRTGLPDGFSEEYAWEQVWNGATFVIPDHGYSDELEEAIAAYYKLPIHPHTCENFVSGVVGIQIPEESTLDIEEIQKIFETVKSGLSAEDAAKVRLHVFPYLSY